MPTMRQKKEFDLNLSDREIFDGLSLGDVWQDCLLGDVYRYIRGGTRHCVPPSWERSLAQLDRDLAKFDGV